MSQTNPFADVLENWTKSFSQFSGSSIPGLNIDGLMKTGQANMAAITEANRIAFEGLQAVAKRQPMSSRSRPNWPATRSRSRSPT
jgi:hypothetical protein